MKKRRFIWVFLILCGIIAGVSWLGHDDEPLMMIEGKLTAKEVDQIKSAVRSDMRHYIFSKCTLAMAKNLPHLAMAYAHYRIVCIDCLGGGVGYVILKRKHDDVGNYIWYDLLKQGNDWNVANTTPESFN